MLEKNINEVLLSGVITSVYQGIGGYTLFNMKCRKYDGSKVNVVYTNQSIREDLYYKYKDMIVKDSAVYIKGYINSYKDRNNNINMLVSVIEVSRTYGKIYNGRKAPYIRYDPDGVMVWDGKRCESTKLSDEELEELENLLAPFKDENE